MIVFYDPGYQPAPTMPVCPPVKPIQPDPPFPLDREIVNFLNNEPEAVSTRRMVNAVAAALHPANRGEPRAEKAYSRQDNTPHLRSPPAEGRQEVSGPALKHRPQLL